MTLTDDQISDKLLVNPDTLGRIKKDYSFMQNIDMDKAYEAFTEFYVKLKQGGTGAVDSHAEFSKALGISRHEAKVLVFSIATDSLFIRRIMMDHEDLSNEVKTKNLTALYEPS